MFGLFGGGRSSTARDYRQRAAGAGGMLGTMAQGYRGLADAGRGLMQGFGNRFRTRADEYDATLGKGLGMDNRAAFMTRATGDVNRPYQQGMANLTANLQRRGLSPDSSVGAGALARLESDRAAQVGQAGLATGMHFDEEEQERARLRAMYAQQLYGQGADMTQMGLSGASGMYGQQAGLFGNLADAEQAEYERANRGLLGGISEFIAPIAQIYGMSQMSRSPQPVQRTPYAVTKPLPRSNYDVRY